MSCLLRKTGQWLAGFLFAGQPGWTFRQVIREVLKPGPAIMLDRYAA